MKKPRLISVDELRAAGALDVPPEWRKSLAKPKRRERDLFSDLVDDDAPGEQLAAEDDEPEDEESPDEES